MKMIDLDFSHEHFRAIHSSTSRHIPAGSGSADPGRRGLLFFAGGAVAESGFPHHFPQIYIPCFDFCSSVATQLERDLRDPIGHFLALTYLNESAKTFQTKTSFPAVIAELINRAISELSPKRAIKIRFDYVGSIAQKQTLWKVLLAFFIPGDAHAQSVSSLEISINSSYIVLF